jgi:hypothetical protein
LHRSLAGKQFVHVALLTGANHLSHQAGCRKMESGEVRN